jgi:hypothetical protein
MFHKSTPERRDADLALLRDGQPVALQAVAGLVHERQEQLAGQRALQRQREHY